MAASLGFSQGSWMDPDDEEESGPGRVLTLEEFMERLRNRPDIFGVDKSYRLRNTEILTLVIALLAGLWATSASRGIVTVKPEFYERGYSGGEVTLAGAIPRLNPQPAAVERPKSVSDDGRRVLRNKKVPSNRNSGMRASGGVGSIHARIVKQGILAILSENIVGKDVTGGEAFAKGGFVDKIDAVLLGRTGGIKQGGRTSTGRRGVEGIGFGTGAGSSGFGGAGPGGLGDWYDRLLAPQAADLEINSNRGPPVASRLRAVVNIKERSGQTIGGRSKMEIMRVVMQNLSALRYAYNQRLREKPGLKGKITVKFVIDEFGNVMHCEVVESSMADNLLETTVTAKIIRWKFERIDKPGDLTEVVYPFVFST
jgi:TonB family protein